MTSEKFECDPESGKSHGEMAGAVGQTLMKNRHRMQGTGHSEL